MPSSANASLALTTYPIHSSAWVGDFLHKHVPNKCFGFRICSMVNAIRISKQNDLPSVREVYIYVVLEFRCTRFKNKKSSHKASDAVCLELAVARDQKVVQVLFPLSSGGWSQTSQAAPTAQA
jgi:hypothetical protein